MILNTGRTICQGDAVERKLSPEYETATSVCFFNPLDMMDLALTDGDRVLVRGQAGSVVLRAAENEDQERGSCYVPYGMHANQVIPAETHATGMPDFKSMKVEVEPTDEPVKTIAMLVLDLGGVPYAP
jgi:formylmethanofuran dehydrogenase subunit D